MDGATAGRFWVGSTFDPSSARRSTGLLHRVIPNGDATTVRSAIGVPTGSRSHPTVDDVLRR
jgi:sugar lactone lactonase YvrE